MIYNLKCFRYAMSSFDIFSLPQYKNSYISGGREVLFNEFHEICNKMYDFLDSHYWKAKVIKN